MSSTVYAHQSHGFKIEQWQDCARQEQCQVMAPKNWTQEEFNLIDGILRKLKESGLQDFLSIAQKKVQSFERVTFWYSFGINPFLPEYEPVDYIYAMALPDGLSTIAFTDRFFNDEVDYLSQASMVEITLLHELVHAFDAEKKLSTHPEFYELAGFKSAHKEFFIPVYAFAQEHEIDQVTDRSLYSSDLEAQLADRLFAMSKGLPRTYSMRNLDEAFADIVTFVYYDPNAKTYIKPQLIKFIDQNVLKGARAY